MAYYKQLKEEYGANAKIPKGWRILRVGELKTPHCKVFLWSSLTWEYYEWHNGLIREPNWDISRVYIKPKD